MKTFNQLIIKNFADNYICICIFNNKIRRYYTNCYY